MIKFPGFSDQQFLMIQEPDPDKRDKNYYLHNVKAFYTEYINSQSTVGYDGIARIEYLRAFAEGRQPVKKEPTTVTKQSAVLDVNGNPIQYESDVYPVIDWSAEVWDILSPANKIMDALSGSLTKMDFEVSCDPMDYGTKQWIEDEKLRRWAYSKNRVKVQFAAKLAGIEMPEPDFIPESPEDLEQNTEEFLPDHARYIEQVIKHTFDISHWAPDTVTLFYRDLFICNKACVQNRYDPEDGKVKAYFIDLAMADTQKSKWIDCRDNERGWHFELMSISQLRQYFPDEPEEFFKQAAASYAGYFGNPGTELFARYSVQDPYGRWGYDAYKACVGNFEWIDINKTKQVEYERKGRRIVKDVPLGKKDDVDKVVRFADERMRFQAKWVVGTDRIFEYGPAYDVTYPSENDTELTYKWIVLPGKSKIEQLVPVFENFYDLWKKYQEQLRNAQGKIQFIDIDMLASAAGQSDGDPNKAAKNAFRKFLATNKLLFRRVNSAGLPNQNKPIEEMDGGMGSLFVQIQAAFKTNIDMVEYITGLNPVSLGQSANPNAPVTTTQMVMNATANVLRPLVDAYMRMKQMVSENAARWIVVLVRGNEYSRNAYKSVIGEYGIQALIAANKSEAAYGFKLVPRPNDLEKQWLLQNLQAATTPMQGGAREISTADANKILNMIASGTPMKTIQHYFEKARDKQKAAIMAEKRALMQEQSALNQQDAAAAGQRDAAIEQQRHANKADEIEATSKGNIGNTIAQETLRKDKETEVARIKTQPAE